jgi:lipopolysaccharide transport system ATP-binding protein
MYKPAIRAINIGKCYRRSAKKVERELLGAAALRMVQAPFRAISRATDDEVIWSLRNVSFEVPKGDAIAFVGANGSGKSTLLKILSRITEPTEGSAEVRGKLGSLLELGTGFHPELTGRENIFLSASTHGISRRQVLAKFEQIVDFSEVEHLLDAPVKYYSSGEYVRLGFAVAAHLEREILLIDEILAVGDAAFQTKCMNKMTSLCSEGRTVVFVTHTTSFVEELCNKTLWLDKGSVVEWGDTAKVLPSYLDFMTARGAVDESKNLPCNQPLKKEVLMSSLSIGK